MTLLAEGLVDPDSQFEVDPELFRSVMSAVCSPVTVVTTMDGHVPCGTTVSAFTSLSLDPPMVLVTLDRDSDLLKALQTSQIFGVNVLSRHQTDLALRFARKGVDRFEAVAWSSHDGQPRLPGCLAWLSCRATQFVTGGDHIVVFGEVRNAERTQTEPLTYLERGFGTHAPHPSHQQGVNP